MKRAREAEGWLLPKPQGSLGTFWSWEAWVWMSVGLPSAAGEAPGARR